MKRVTLAIAVLLTTLVFSACGNDSGENQETGGMETKDTFIKEQPAQGMGPSSGQPVSGEDSLVRDSM